MGTLYGKCIQEPLARLSAVERLRLRLGPDASTARFVNHSAGEFRLSDSLDPQDGLTGSDQAPRRVSTVEILVPPEWVIRRTIELPLSVIMDPRRGIQMAISGLSPGAPDSIYFDFHVSIGIPGGNRVRFELLMMSSQRVKDWILWLEQHGYKVTSVTSDQGWQGNNLLPPEQTPRPSLRPVLHNALMLSVLIALLGVAWNIPLWKHEATVAALDTAAKKLIPDATITEAVVRSLQRRTRAVQDLLQARQSSRPMVDILLELTNLYSDTSWASSLRISNGEVMLRGETRDAGALVERLEKSPMFEGVALRGPVTQIKGTFYETYALEMRLSKTSMQ